MVDLMENPVKKTVEDLLITREHDTLLDLCEQDRRFWQEVRFRLYDLDERVRWSAIEADSEIHGALVAVGQAGKGADIYQDPFLVDERGIRRDWLEFPADNR